MFKDILNCVDFDLKDPFLTLISSSSNSDSSFLIHHFLSCAIRSKKQVYFVNLAQTWSHYKSVQMKIGNNVLLNELVDSGRFQQFDFVKQNSLFCSKSEPINWQQAFDNLLIKLEEKSKQNYDSNIFVIIDDLSILSLIGCDDHFIFEFVNKLQSFHLKLNLIMQLQAFWSNSFVLNDLVYLSDVYFKIEDLVTGYSKDIQGQVCFLYLF